jgi:hypothetical protein
MRLSSASIKTQDGAITLPSFRPDSRATVRNGTAGAQCYVCNTLGRSLKSCCYLAALSPFSETRGQAR